tara:strand:+ start:1172 stop:1753 length:582 start_codon:yes stop_codon:yes gene_type:complete
MSYKPFKMKGHTLPGIRQKSHDTQSGKSPYQKELVGDQENLNEGLKRAIKAAPAKQKKSKLDKLNEKYKKFIADNTMGDDPTTLEVIYSSGESNKEADKINKKHSKFTKKFGKLKKSSSKASIAKQRLKSEHPDTYVYDGDLYSEKVIDLEDRIGFIKEDMFNERGDSTQQKEDIATLKGKLKTLKATKPKNK